MSGFKVAKIRSTKHLAFVRSQACLVHDGKGNRCNGTIIQAHHLTFCGGHGIALKECDSLTVPLCHSHHINLHHIGEKQWWKHWDIDAEQEAKNLAMLSPDKRVSKLYTIIE